MPGRHCNNLRRTELLNIFRASVWASYEVFFAILPVALWIFVILFSDPVANISLHLPAFSFFCVSIWGAYVREVPRTFNSNTVKDKFERECAMVLGLLGLTVSMVCLVFAALRSTGSIDQLWGPFSLTVATSGLVGVFMLFILLSIKIQRLEYGRGAEPAGD